MKNSRCAIALRSLASYYSKEPGLLFAVRLAQGLTHAGKGLVTLSPYHPDRSVCHPVVLAGIVSLGDCVKVILETTEDRVRNLEHFITGGYPG